MKTKNAIKVGQEVFAAEPMISRVQAHFLTIREETYYIHLRIFVDGDINEGRASDSSGFRVHGAGS